MTIIEKFMGSVYEYLVIIIKFIPIAVITTIVKLLYNIKNKTEKNFTDVFLEFSISILLSCVIGYLVYSYVGEKQAIILTAIVAWSGSKITIYIDSWIGKYIKKYNNDNNDSSIN